MTPGPDHETIDWNAIWMDLQRRNIASGRGGECWHSWNDLESAEGYARVIEASEGNARRVGELLALVGPGSRVLDVGAGPGNLALPLAQRVAHVTAVEPAQGMVAVLERQVAHAGVTNLRLVPRRWDDVEPADLEPPYDLTVASFSLGMVDLRASLEKMMAVTSGRVVVYWHAGPQSWDRDAIALWPLLHGRPYEAIPKGEVVYNLLYSLNIYPEVQTFRSTSVVEYTDLDQAVERYVGRFDVTTASQRADLTRWLDRELAHRDGKRVMVCDDVSLRFSWSVGGHGRK